MEKKEETKKEIEIKPKTAEKKKFEYGKFFANYGQVFAIVSAVLIVIVVYQAFVIAGMGGTGTTDVSKLIREITPTGTPDYGEAAGVSYDRVEESLTTMAGYESSISLSGADQTRYIGIATSKDTACEYCCGIGDKGFGTEDGSIACGCSHNVAFGGLTKWLIKNSDYTDDQIKEEINKWKILFFPQKAIAAELQKRGVSPEAAGLPSMVGGC